MKRKRVVFSLITLFVIVYVAVGVWISHDTKIILVKAMSGAADYKVYMNDKTYQNINPVTRDMTTIPYVYDKKYHEKWWDYNRYFYMIEFGCDVYFITRKGPQDEKNLESDILGFFYEKYRALPVGNSALSIRR